MAEDNHCGPSGLERAVALYLDWLENGADAPHWQELLQRNPDLGEHLEALRNRGGGEAEDDGPQIGTYRILGELGRGGMGVVYDGYDGALDRRVAVKVLTAHLTLQPSAVARFKREALAAARLDHRGIVKILAVGSDGDTHWFAMERIDGPNLLDWHPESMRDTVRIGADLADALAHAHAQGVLHRDVKPANVLLRHDGQPVLTDFGLAREVDLPSLTRTGGFLGTPNYVSPEQARGREVDPRSDLFSLGATLYQLCTGRLPFDAPEPQQVIEKILRTEPVDPCRLQRGIDRDLAAVLLRALEKDPARRYQSALAMARDLRAWLAGEPVSARMPSMGARAWRWAKREPARAMLAVVLVLGVPALAASLGYQIANEPALAAGRAAQRRHALDLLLARGFRSLADEDADGARAAFQDALQLDQTSTEGRLGAALSLLAQRRFDEVQAAIDQQPEPAEVFQRVRVQIARGRGDEAEAARLEASLPEPRGSVAQFAAGEMLFERGRLQEDQTTLRLALRHFQVASLASSAPRPLFHFQLAVCAEWAKDDAAESAAVAAIETLWPDDAVALRQVLLRTLEVDPAKAAAGLRAQLQNETEPRHRARLLYDLGYACQLAKDDHGAVAAYAEAVAANPRYLPAHNNLGLAHERLNEPEEAIAAWRNGLAVDPQACKLHNNLGRLLRRTGHPDDAIAAYRAAVAARPDYAVAWFNLGNSLAAKGGQHEEALAALRHAIAAEPGYGRAHANLGELCLVMERNDEAVPPLREAVRLLPADLRPRLLLARALALTGDHAGARASLEAAVVALPRSAEAWIALSHQLIADEVPATSRDPAFALVAARKAVELGKTAPALVTLAEAQIANGDHDGAQHSLDAAAIAKPIDAATDARLEKARQALPHR
ncbi:MAG: protein kinase [Planctomycetota bacterium]